MVPIFPVSSPKSDCPAFRRSWVVLLQCLALPMAALAQQSPAPRVLADVAYLETGRAEKLDLYLPVPPAEGKLSPAVVWIHGGGWTDGTKNEARAKEICTTLAHAGYVAVSIDYMLGDGAWPTNLRDCKNAVRFLRAHAPEYHLDPARIAVAGGSAGGHLALLVGFTAGRGEFEPATPYPGRSSAVRAVIDMYGAADLTVDNYQQRRSTAAKQRVLGASGHDGEVWRTASPLSYVTKDSPPVLVMHGLADDTVNPAQSEQLVRVLQERGVVHEYVTLEGIGHTFSWQRWGKQPLPRDLRPVALAFLEKHLAPAPPH
jgi:acetyl esterase/lipase